MSKKRWYVRRQLKGKRVLFPSDKPCNLDRHKPLTSAQERALLCWAGVE